MNVMTRANHHGGFTLIELMLGMVITTLVVGALGAMMTAVGRGWIASDAVKASSSFANQSAAHLRQVVRGAKQIGLVRFGSLDGSASPDAAVMLWKTDALKTVANGDGTFRYVTDGKVQFSELGMIEHFIGADAAHSELRYYQVAFPSNWTAQQKQAADTPDLADDEIYKSTEVETFKGLENVQYTVLARNIIGCTFKRIDGTSVTRPALEYTLRIQKSDGSIDVEYGTIALRSPTTLPVAQNGA
jgi:hypothetical protein